MAPVEPLSDSDLEQEARRLVFGHRRAFEASGLVQQERRQVKVTNPVLEMAYQSASQIMIALVVPRVHPVVPLISRRLFRREYPDSLASPALSVFVAGIHAKFALDVASLWGLPPFRWVQPQPLRSDMLHPFSLRGLELNVLASALGVCLGRAAVALRENARFFAERLIGGSMPWVLKTFGGLALHLTISSVLPPMVVQELTVALRDSQFRGRLLAPTVLVQLWGRGVRTLRQALAAARRWGSGHPVNVADSRFDEVPWWEGAEDDAVPKDLVCPITGSAFVWPVALHGMLFEEAAVKRWVETTGRHPVLQGAWCHLGELVRASDIEALCHRCAAERGWVLRDA